MGVLLEKFSKTENKGKSAVKHARPSFFGSRKTVPVLTKLNQTFSCASNGSSLKIIKNIKLNGILESCTNQQNNSVRATPSLAWNYEDEYKSYIQKSIKRKSGKVDQSFKRKLLKICTNQSDLKDSLVCDDPLDKIETSLNTLRSVGNLNALLMNGTVSLDRLPDSKHDACIQIDYDKSLMIQNTKAKIRTCSRSNSKAGTNNGNNKLKNLQIMELTSEPVVVLDQTIVSKYLQAKRIIDRIMKPYKTTSNFKGNYLSTEQ